MLNSDISCFENSVDPDQLASEKQADEDLHCFPHCWQICVNKWKSAIKWDEQTRGQTAKGTTILYRFSSPKTVLNPPVNGKI